MKAHRLRNEEELRYLEGDKLVEAKHMQRKAVEEVARNREDAVFYAGRRICFGQAIQVGKHICSACGCPVPDENSEKRFRRRSAHGLMHLYVADG